MKSSRKRLSGFLGMNHILILDAGRWHGKKRLIVSISGPLINCVALGKTFSFSQTQFTH